MTLHPADCKPLRGGPVYLIAGLPCFFRRKIDIILHVVKICLINMIKILKDRKVMISTSDYSVKIRRLFSVKVLCGIVGLNRCLLGTGSEDSRYRSWEVPTDQQDNTHTEYCSGYSRRT